MPNQIRNCLSNSIKQTIVSLGIIAGINNIIIKPAMSMNFNPTTINETNDLSDVFDDDVDVTGTVDDPILLTTGNMITWNYMYTKN